MLSKSPHTSPRLPARDQTARQSLLDALDEYPQHARDLSQAAGLPEKEVYEHLTHIQKSLKGSKKTLVIHRAYCSACGFEFQKRDQFKKPSRCPECRRERIVAPAYSVK